MIAGELKGMLQLVPAHMDKMEVVAVCQRSGKVYSVHGALPVGLPEGPRFVIELTEIKQLTPHEIK